MDVTEKRKTFLINFLYFLIILVIAIFICRYAISAVLPFLIALVVSLLIRPLVTLLSQKLHVHKGIAGIVVTVLFYALIGFLLVILGVKLFASGKAFFMRLPYTYNHTIQPWLTGLFQSIENISQKLNPEAAAAYDVISSNVTSTIGDAVSSLSKSAVGWVTSITVKTPGVLLNALITIIATVYFAIDWPVLRAFVVRQLKPASASMLASVREHLGRTLGRYVRSYALIMFITFLELSLGLSILRIENAFGLAAIIAVFDILPVVGSGTVLIPWAAVCVIQGNYSLALGLAIVYVIIVVIRNIIEPKIVGDKVGLHPLLTLSSMVVGTYVFGPVGLLGLPVTLALLVSLNEAGVIHIYNRLPAQPEPAADGPSPAAGATSAEQASPRKKQNRKQAK